MTEQERKLFVKIDSMTPAERVKRYRQLDRRYNKWWDIPWMVGMSVAIVALFLVLL